MKSYSSPFIASACAALLSSFVAGCSDDESTPANTSGPTASSAGSGGGGVGGGGGGGDTGGAGGQTSTNPADYVQRPLREQVEAIEAGAITSVGLTEAYLERIAEVDTPETGIRAYIRLDPAAAGRAAEVDGLVGAGALLQGVSIALKDNIDTEGLATTAGSLALENNVPTADAPIVAKIRAANGVVLGKTNLSEWANFRGYGSFDGWSSLGGQTTNGLDPEYSPCGSSSGSAAAVAAGTASAALGTETDGSIVCPASINGVVGFKPTVGLVSRTGVIPISSTQDTVGPMARTVADAARLLTVIAGPDAADPATANIPAGMSLDFDAALEGATLSGKRLGVLGQTVPSPIQALFDAEKAKMVAAGAVLVDVDFNTFVQAWELPVLLHEFKVGINAYLASHPGGPSTLADLIAFNEANAETVMPLFGQELFLMAEETTGLDSQEYLDAKAAGKAAAGANGIDMVLTMNDLDAIIVPTARTAWVIDYEEGDAGGFSVSGPAAVAGYPHLTVPMGLVEGLPAGVSFYSTAWRDAEVLALGHAYETLPE